MLFALSSEGVPIVSKPWRSQPGERFGKSDFKLDLRRLTITCPAGQTEKIATPSGREALRDRVQIEHRLSHHARKQGLRARSLGVRNNVFDSRRHAATINLETLQLAKAA